MVAVIVTSGIWMRVNRNSPTQVLKARPAYRPARCRERPRSHAIRQPAQQHGRKRDGHRATQSCTPKTLNASAIIQ